MLTTSMASILLYVAIVSTHTMNCPPIDEDHLAIPQGIAEFDRVFEINKNEQLQALRATVLEHRCQFGDDDLSSAIFSFAETYHNLNCGAYGAQPQYVQAYHDHIRGVLQSRPHLWDDVHSAHVMDILRAEIAHYFGIADYRDLVFTINASHGLNAVILSLLQHFSLALNSNELRLRNRSIIYFNTGHSSFVSPLKYYQRLFAFHLIEIAFDAATLRSYDSILQRVNDTLNALGKDASSVLFAVFSHITAVPTLILPVKEITALFRAHGIVTVIDGAHVMGQINDVNLTDIACDVYVSNAYKWFFSVWNTAVLFVSKPYQSVIHPLAIAYDIPPQNASIGDDEAEAAANALYHRLWHHPGSIDRATYLSLMASMEFRHLIGGNERIAQYMHELAVQAQSYLAQLWNTTQFSSNHSHFVAMVNVELPDMQKRFGVEINRKDIYDIYLNALQAHDVSIKLFEWNGKFYIRLSCNIYNNMKQIELVGDLVLTYLHELKVKRQKLNENKDEL